MTKINLLPSEILEKRKTERRLVYYIGAFLILILFLVGIYSFGAIQVGNDEEKLAELKTENQKLNQTIAEYKVYEQRKGELQKLEGIVSTALSGEIAWHKILTEISMVIPPDVWLSDFDGSAESIDCKGYAVDFDNLGHKPVAEWINKISEIKILTSIWLTFSQKTTFRDKPAIEFELTTQLKGGKPASAPPAPPAQK